jgi:hypothetical protein
MAFTNQITGSIQTVWSVDKIKLIMMDDDDDDDDDDAKKDRKKEIGK